MARKIALSCLAGVRHHRLALGVLALAAVLDVIAGAVYAAVMSFPFTSGLAYALGVATTSGSSVPAGTTGSARLATAVIQATVLPLFGAVFSLFTSALSSIHVRAAERRIKKHTEETVAGVQPE